MVVRIDKKDLIIDGAVAIFAENGYYKATTAQIAKAAGVTQPYVFHFFANKEALYLAVIARAFSRVFEVFTEITAPSDQLYGVMGKAFINIMQSHRDEILLMMQSQSISEPVIRKQVKANFQLIYESVSEKFRNAGVADPQGSASQFISEGLLITLAEILQLPMLCDYKGSKMD